MVAAVRFPDGLIRDPDEAEFIGNDIFNSDGADQTKKQVVSAGVAAVYAIRIHNDGNLTDQFKVSGPADGEGWRMRYYDAPTGGTDVTYAVRHNGWLTGPVARGAMRDLRVEVTPDPPCPRPRRRKCW